MWLFAILVMGCNGADKENTDDTSVDTSDTSNSWNFRSPETCGTCHPTHYDQWRESSHAYGAVSPVFDITSTKFFRDRGGGALTFCTGCHTPYGTVDGEPGSTLASDRSEESKKGVTCDVCHSAVNNNMAYEHMLLDFRKDGVVVGGIGSDYSGFHSSEKTDFISNSEMCGGCHDTIKDYRGTLSEQNGESCQDCHMSTTPGAPSAPVYGPAAVVGDQVFPDRELHDHRFIGIDPYLLDTFPYPDDPSKNEVVREHHREDVLAMLKRGAKINNVSISGSGNNRKLTVSIESLIAAHSFPALSPIYSMRQFWIDIRVTDSNGSEVIRSGDLDSYGDLRDDRSLDVRQGNTQVDDMLGLFQFKNEVKLTSQNNETPRTTLYQFDRSSEDKSMLEPLEIRAVEYPLPGINGAVNVEVKLKYRTIPPYIMRPIGLADKMHEVEPFIIDEKVMEGMQ